MVGAPVANISPGGAVLCGAGRACFVPENSWCSEVLLLTAATQLFNAVTFPKVRWNSLPGIWFCYYRTVQGLLT